MDKTLHMVLKVYSTTWNLYFWEHVTVRNKLMEQKASSVIAEFILKCDSSKKKKRHLPYQEGLHDRLWRKGTQ